MNIFLVDCETTGFSPEKDSICEFAGILYNSRYDRVLGAIQTVFPVVDNPADTINGIDVGLAVQSKNFVEQGVRMALALAEKADVIIAHNAGFDKGFVAASPLLQSLAITKPWICSLADIDWDTKTGKLLHLAAEKGVRIPDPRDVHTAMGDCQILLGLIRTLPSLEAVIKLGLEPKVFVVAIVDYANRHLAEKARFTWNKIVPQKWAKAVPQSKVSEFSASLNFPFVIYG